MPVIQELLNFNEMFHTLRHTPTLINTLACATLEDREKIKEQLTTHLNSDQISLVSSCQCGHTKGEYSKNTICPVCHTEVKASVTSDIEPVIWLKQPIGVEKLISPIVLMMLMKRFTKSGFSVIEWLCNTNYTTAAKVPDKVLTRLQQCGVERGYNHFVNNFDKIMDILFNMVDFAPKTQKFEAKAEAKIDFLQQLLHDNRHMLFSEYLPLPNKTILIFDTQPLGTYADPSVLKAVDAANTMVSIDRDFWDQSPKTKQNRTIKALIMLCDFYNDTLLLMAHKHGHYRKHMFGSRTNFSFRAVITSITSGKMYDEVEAPWCMAITAFRIHMLNKLLRYGMGHNEALGFLYKHTYKHHPLLETFMKEFIDESPLKGLFICLQRNQLGCLH